MVDKMPRNDSTQAIRSLIGAYTEDEGEGDGTKSGSDIDISDEEDLHREQLKPEKRSITPDSTTSTPSVRPAIRVTKLVSYVGDDNDDDADESMDEDEERESSNTPGIVDYDASFSSEMQNIRDKSLQDAEEDEDDDGDVKLPPEPQGRCSKKLQEKILELYDNIRNRGVDMNKVIQGKKQFRNPSIYEKLISFVDIDEKGTNYPPELYNPMIWGKESYFDELAKTQKLEMDKREKDKKDRTKVDFVVGTKKTTADGLVLETKQRKSKWDAQPQQSKPGAITANPAVVSITGTSSNAKTTVISAIGTIKKDKK